MLMGYGVDFLTLRMLTDQISALCTEIGIPEYLHKTVRAFYRCSFGRGGAASFGEFDFILMVPGSDKLYLGESKWDGRRKRSSHAIKLEQAQIRRHAVLKQYITRYYDSGKSNEVKSLGINEPGSKTLLDLSLQEFEKELKLSYPEQKPEVHNILLYFYDENLVSNEDIPVRVERCFTLEKGSARKREQTVLFDFVPVSYTSFLHDKGPFVTFPLQDQM